MSRFVQETVAEAAWSPDPATETDTNRVKEEL